MSGVIAGVSLSQDRGSSDSDNQRASDAMSEALGQSMGQTLAQMISKNLNVAPTIEIRPGYRLNVMVTKDIEFPGPYVSTLKRR
jgi:type IV secretion system protein VirB10